MSRAMLAFGALAGSMLLACSGGSPSPAAETVINPGQAEAADEQRSGQASVADIPTAGSATPSSESESEPALDTSAAGTLDPETTVSGWSCTTLEEQEVLSVALVHALDNVSILNGVTAAFAARDAGDLALSEEALTTFITTYDEMASRFARLQGDVPPRLEEFWRAMQEATQTTRAGLNELGAARQEGRPPDITPLTEATLAWRFFRPLLNVACRGTLPPR